MRAHICMQSFYTRSKAEVNVSELIHNILASTTIDDDLGSYEEAMLSRHKRRSSSELVSVISVKPSIISLNNVLLVNSLFPQHVFPLLYRSHYHCESTLQPAGAWEPAWEPS